MSDYEYNNYEEVTPKDKDNLVEWNSMKKGFFDDSEKRTLHLTSKMSKANITFTGKSVLDPCHSIKYQTNEDVIHSTNNVSDIVINALEVLKKKEKDQNKSGNQNFFTEYMTKVKTQVMTMSEKIRHNIIPAIFISIIYYIVWYVIFKIIPGILKYGINMAMSFK